MYQPYVLPSPEMLLLIFNQTEVVDQFFVRADLSDIQTDEYFQNPYKMSMFSLLMEPSYWKRLSVSKETSHLVCSVLLWINGQLVCVSSNFFSSHSLISFYQMNPNSRCAVQKYNDNLPSRMQKMINEIYEQAFLPFYTEEPYFSNLWIYDNTTGKSVALNFISLLDGSGETLYWEEDLSFQIPTGFLHGNFSAFNDRVFGGTINSPNRVETPTISRANWYPHLAAFLLNILVKYLYHKLHPHFEGHADVVENQFSHIVECLPYARPTPQNLESIRALRYLYPNLGYPWFPPLGFCQSTIDLLLVWG